MPWPTTLLRQWREKQGAKKRPIDRNKATMYHEVCKLF
jgi:hypothetical protein